MYIGFLLIAWLPVQGWNDVYHLEFRSFEGSCVLEMYAYLQAEEFCLDKHNKWFDDRGYAKKEVYLDGIYLVYKDNQCDKILSAWVSYEHHKSFFGEVKRNELVDRIMNKW